MPPPPSPYPTVIIDVAGGGRLEHPVLDGASVCVVIARLAPHIPVPALWAIRPANHGKVTGESSAPRPQGATS